MAKGLSMQRHLNFSYNFIKQLSTAILLSAFASNVLAAQSGQKPQATPVPVIKAQMAAEPYQRTHSARLKSVQAVEVHARITTNIKAQHFVEGSQVKAGQKLYTLDNSRVKASYEVALAAVNSAKVRLDQARVTYNRTKGLGKNVSEQSVDDAYAAWKAAQSELNAAEAALLSAKIQLKDAIIVAEIDGIVGQTQQDVGALVNASTKSLLTSITQTNQLYALFTVSDADRRKRLQLVDQGLLELSPTASVELLDSSGQALITGKVDYVAPNIDIATAAQVNRAIFSNPDQRFLPGQFINVKVTYGQWQNVFSIPKKAIIQNGPQAFVYVVEQGKAVMKAVNLVGSFNHNWLINSGLKEGDQIISGNIVKVRPNAPVKIMTESSDSKNSQ